MKKFISALSSLVLTATAMGGALTFSADAATNGKVDNTIISFRSGGKNEVKVEKGGVSVPVSVYVPQSNGFHSLFLKMAINGDATLGKGTVTDHSGKEHTNFKYAFSNYGIELKNNSWAKEEPICLDSGAYVDSAEAADPGYDGGYFNNSGYCFFTADSYYISYQATHALLYDADDDNPRGDGPHNIDSYSAWVAAGSPESLVGYECVETWTKDEAWAYDTSLISFDMVLPADLPDGTYVLDLYTDAYKNCTPSSLFDETTNELLPDDKIVSNQTSVKGVEGSTESAIKSFKSEPLTLIVGDGGSTTTTSTSKSTSETTKTTTGSKVDTENKIIYNLIPQDKDYTAVADDMTGNNTMKATAGEEIVVDWTVKNDQGTAGLQMTFDFSGVTYVKAAPGKAYRGNPEFNDGKAASTGEINYAYASGTASTAKDDAVIYSFTVKAPESGSATIGMKTGSGINNKVVPLEDGKTHDFLFHGLTINVEDANETTTTVTTKSETTASTTKSETTKSETTTTSVITTTKTETSINDGHVLYGDVNCNEKVQINDVVLLNRYLAKTATVSEQGLKNAECTGDGKVSQDDSTAIKEFLARLITALPKK